MRTTITIEESARPSTRRKTGAAALPTSRRFMVRVPSADTSFARWWATQDDPSASVRALVRAEIQANGFTDIVNRPVTPPDDKQGGSINLVDLMDALSAIRLTRDLGLVHA